MVKAPSTVYTEPVILGNPSSLHLFDRYRYTLLNFDKLTLVAKLSANKHNLVNITKSGIKQI